MAYIDRDELRRWIEGEIKSPLCPRGEKPFGRRILMRIMTMPSTQLERKRGKWVRYDGDWLKTMCKCSECGAMIDINEKYRNFFCYHCGADMREESDNEISN